MVFKPGTIFEVQISKSKNGKSGYVTRSRTDNAAQASVYYNGLNVAYGYKKRLLADGKVVHRVTT